MPNRLIRALAGLLVLAAAAGCRQEVLDRPTGEIGVVYEAEGSTRTDRDAKYDFGSVFSAQSVTKKIVIKNVGRGQISLKSLEPVEGELGSTWSVTFEPTTLNSSEFLELDATFAPPESEGPVDYVLKLQLTAENTVAGEETATITLTGRGVPGRCELPKTLDFGNVAIDDTFELSFELKNPTLLPAEATVGDITSSSGDHNAFNYSAESPRGLVTMEPDTNTPVTIGFRPTEKKSYLAFMKARASAQCPEQTITLTGAGVDSVLSWVPAQVDCGYVTPGYEVVKDVTFTNQGNVDAQLSAIKTLNNSEFRVVAEMGADATKLTVPGKGGSAVLKVACKPAVLGPRQTQLTFTTSLPKQPQGAITVKVYGGGPDIEVKPAPNLNFGKVAYFSNANPPSFQKKKLTVMNVGTKPATMDTKANLKLGTQDANGNYVAPFFDVMPLNQDTAQDEFKVELVPSYDPATGLEAAAGKNVTDLIVTVTPKSVGLKQAEITIYSNDPDEPAVKIVAAADAVVLPPCNYTVTPSNLNFGLISPPDYRDLAFTIKNNGTNPGDICLLSGLDITNDQSPGFFSLPTGAVDSKELAPGEVMQVPVRVWPQGQTPSSVSAITGKVDFFMSSPIKPQSTVTLTAQLAPSCLTIAPDELDYGTVQVGCSSPTKTFNVYNTCSTPVTISNFSMQAAAGQPAGGPNCQGSSACPEYILVQSPAIPPSGLTLTSGQAPISFQVKYKPIDLGVDTGAVAISATQNGGAVTYVVSLHGEGNTTGIHTDVYTQDSKPKADILLVIDDSGSMGPYQQSLSTNFASFIKYAQSAAVDYHIAVIKTEANTPDFAQFWSGPSHPEKILTPTTVDVENKFKAKVNVGTTGGWEMEAEPALKALTAPLINSHNAGFLRNDAALAIVAVTDEPDQSPQSTTYYLNGFWNIKGFSRKTMFTFNAIAGLSSACPGDSGELAYYIAQTNGVGEDLCTPDWAKALENLGKTAFGFRTNFFLTSPPDLTKGPIEVHINGMPVAAVDERGATVWTYDSVGNSVNFEPMYVPEPGQTMTITYNTTCYP